MRTFLKIFSLSLVLIFGLVFTFCKKDEKGLSEPECIHKRINNFDKSSDCGSACVKKYRFQGGEVYAFDPGTCGADMTTEVVDKNCNTLGYLGGIAGNTTINGENFSNAVFISTVWTK